MLCMVSSVARNGPSFYTVLHCRRIPAAFKELIGENVTSSSIFLKELYGRSFKVLVYKDDDGELAMQEGLEEFMLSNRTSESNFLVYNYDGELRLHVHVFNPSGVEMVQKNQTSHYTIAASAKIRKRGSCPRKHAKEDQMLLARVEEKYQNTEDATTKKIPDFLTVFRSNQSLAMLFLNFSSEKFDDFKTKYNEVADLYKEKGLVFLLCDSKASHGIFQYFGLNEDQVPVILIQTRYSRIYLKANVEPDKISPCLKEYMAGKLRPYEKSKLIRVGKNGPVKVVVQDNIQEMVFKSGKNVSKAQIKEIARFYEEQRAYENKEKALSDKSEPGHVGGSSGNSPFDELAEKYRMMMEQLDLIDKTIGELHLRARPAEGKCEKFLKSLLEVDCGMKEKDDGIKSEDKDLETARNK